MCRPQCLEKERGRKLTEKVSRISSWGSWEKNWGRKGETIASPYPKGDTNGSWHTWKILFASEWENTSLWLYDLCMRNKWFRCLYAPYFSNVFIFFGVFADKRSMLSLPLLVRDLLTPQLCKNLSSAPILISKNFTINHYQKKALCYAFIPIHLFWN